MILPAIGVKSSGINPQWYFALYFRRVQRLNGLMNVIQVKRPGKRLYPKATHRSSLFPGNCGKPWRAHSHSSQFFPTPFFSFFYSTICYLSSLSLSFSSRLSLSFSSRPLSLIFLSHCTIPWEKALLSSLPSQVQLIGKHRSTQRNWSHCQLPCGSQQVAFPTILHQVIPRKAQTASKFLPIAMITSKWLANLHPYTVFFTVEIAFRTEAIIDDWAIHSR